MMGQHGTSQSGRQHGWEQDAPTIALRVHRAGPLGSLHDRQRRWPSFGRFLWWAFLLPLAIFAWSSWRLRGVLRFGGYIAAGWVLMFGLAIVAAATTPPTVTVPTSVAQASPAPALAVASPAAAPPAPVASPVVAVAVPVVRAPIAPPTVRPVVPKETHARPASRPAATRPSTPKGSGISSGDTYTNVDGNQIQRPVAAASQPSGATAKCKDGTWSFSQHRSGTCSGHGGVAQSL
jgi:Protein of unknown function (DUF3761)